MLQITLRSTEERELNCGLYVDSRPPPSKFSWKRGTKVIQGSSTYLLTVGDVTLDVEEVECTAYDWLSK